MKDIVVHVSDAVCAANQRDPEATALIEAAKSFGTVETLENALAAERAKAQAEINRLTAQHNAEVDALRAKLAAIEERAVTDAELEILKVIRKKADMESAQFQGEIKRRDEQLAAIVAEQEARKQQIRALYGL
jgi:glucose-6-phosphate isomerase